MCDLIKAREAAGCKLADDDIIRINGRASTMQTNEVVVIDEKSGACATATAPADAVIGVCFVASVSEIHPDIQHIKFPASYNSARVPETILGALFSGLRDSEKIAAMESLVRAVKHPDCADAEIWSVRITRVQGNNGYQCFVFSAVAGNLDKQVWPSDLGPITIIGNEKAVAAAPVEKVRAVSNHHVVTLHCEVTNITGPLEEYAREKRMVVPSCISDDLLKISRMLQSREGGEGVIAVIDVTIVNDQLMTRVDLLRSYRGLFVKHSGAHLVNTINAQGQALLLHFGIWCGVNGIKTVSEPVLATIGALAGCNRYFTIALTVTEFSHVESVHVY